MQQSQDFKNARKNLLENTTAIAQEPWFEIIKPYPSSNRLTNDLTIDDLNGFLNENELQFFKSLVNCGLIGNFPLYEHQLAMLQNYANGNNCIITTGTGSGKTESFLLPLFAYLTKYYLSKSKVLYPNNVDIDRKWYLNPEILPQQNRKDRRRFTEILHRQYDQENTCVKAIIFYPMNALVADQMGRLRSALTSEKAKNLFNQTGKGYIYFGRYNSSSKTVKYSQNGLSNKAEIADEMKEYHDAFQSLKEKIQTIENKLNENQNKEEREKLEREKEICQGLFASTPNPDAAELLNRWDMQQSPPDILITNYSMLNVMMMREEENGMFEKTRDWLACIDLINLEQPEAKIAEAKLQRIFHLIIDELHLNRGTSGAETSWLLQLYLNRIGLYPGHPQLRILASSASIEANNNDSKLFVEKFFGFEQGTFNTTARFNIINSNDVPYNNPQDYLLTPDLLREIKEFIDENPKVKDSELVNQFFNTSIEGFINTYKEEIQSILINAYGTESNLPLNKLAQNLFNNEQDAQNLTEAVLYLRSIFDNDKSVGRIMPRLRMHLFFNNLPGIFAEIGTIDKLSKEPSQYLSNNGNRMAKLLFCYECGTIMYGGYRFVKDANTIELLPYSANLEKAPDQNIQTIPDHLTHQEFVVFWPNTLNNKELHEDANSCEFYPDSNGFTQPQPSVQNNNNNRRQRNDQNNNPKGNWIKAKISPSNANIAFGNNLNEPNGYLFAIDNPEANALPAKCPCCAMQYHYIAKRYTPIHHFSTPHNKTTQILSGQLLKEISDNPSDRKLIAFSDSRHAAAKLAQQIEQDNYWDSIRKIVANINGLNNEAAELLNLLNLHRNNNGYWNNCPAQLQTFLQNKLDGASYQVLLLRGDDPVFFSLLTNLNENNVVSEIVSIQEKLLPSNGSPGLLLSKILKTGIPPMGNTFQVKIEIPSLGKPVNINIREFKDNAQNDKKWYNLYNNLKDGKYDQNQIITNPDVKQLIAEELKKEFTRGLFGKHKFSIEMMAKGYVSFKENVISSMLNNLCINEVTSQERFIQVANTSLRILGYKYRHTATDPNYIQNNLNESITAHHPLRKYFKRVYGENTYEKYLHVILNQIVQHGTLINNFNGIIDISNFNLILAKEESLVYICSNCQTPHLHKSAGVCAHCMNDISNELSIEAKELWKSNYYTEDYFENNEIIRMHTEELTGQTEDFETRQRKFKNLFLEGEDELAEGIDIISATTTMEVGIDIGSLSATLMGNMAPERYNYQQRVGRAGRGGQAFSLALTVCRNSSHDAFYYNNLERILCAPAPTPFVPTELEDIKKRFLFKELLRRVFSEITFNDHHKDASSDTHGRMGYKDIFDIEKDFNQRKEIENNLNNILNDDKDFKNWRNKTGFNNLTSEVILDQIDSLLHGTVTSDTFAQALAEGGLLPLFGMPSNVRNAYLNFNEKKSRSSIERDDKMALSEFAPGGELLRDKKFYPMEGITSQIYNNETLDAVVDERNLLNYHESPDGTIEILNDNNGNNNSQMIFPRAYYSYKEIYQTDNNKIRHSLGIPKLGSQEPNDFKNGINGSLSAKLFKGDAYLINDNSGNLFEFWSGNNAGKSYWSKTPINAQDRTEGFEGSFALGSKSHSYVLEIKPELNINGIQLLDEIVDLNNTFSLHTGVKAAVYSAAFILRDVFTQDLDVSGDEINIIKLKRNQQEETLSILMMDALQNGSGFVQKLFGDEGSGILDSINKCLISGEAGSLSAKLHTDENLKCDSASYQNLLNYRNLSFHSILDWRLGMSYLRVLKGDQSQINQILQANNELQEFKGFNGENNWLNGFHKLFNKFIGDFNLGQYQQNVQLPTAINGNYEIIGIHPLWSINNPEGLLQTAINQARNNGRNPVFIDSFNLLRRPGACHQHILSKINLNNNPMF